MECPSYALVSVRFQNETTTELTKCEPADGNSPSRPGVEPRAPTFGDLVHRLVFRRAILLGAVAGAAPLAAQTGAPSPVVASVPGLFRFHSGFWINLHHFLYAQARARLGLESTRPAVLAALADTAGLGALSAAERDRWNAALAYYERELAPRDATFDSSLIALKTRLANAENASGLGGSGIDTALVARLDGAAAIYRRLWWPAHDAANRAWVRDVVPLLDRYGAAMATGVTRAFRTPWPAAGIRVDMAAYTKGGGAYTTRGPAHVTMMTLDSAYGGLRGVEMLFHESLHTLDDSVWFALRAQPGGMPNGLQHALIFFTPGEVLRRLAPTQVPYPEYVGLWRRAESMGRWLPAMRTEWPAYLDGHGSLAEAMARIIAATPAP